MALNRVTSGEYAGKQIVGGGAMNACIAVGFMKKVYLNKLSVDNYEVLGGVAGATMKRGDYQIKLTFKDGKQSQIEVDEKLYKAIVQACS